MEQLLCIHGRDIALPFGTKDVGLTLGRTVVLELLPGRFGKEALDRFVELATQ
jgi:hypothetical protein